MIIRGRVYVPKLYEPTMYVGGPSNLRFKDGKVIDITTGRLVPTEPFIAPEVEEKASEGFIARLMRYFWSAK